MSVRRATLRVGAVLLVAAAGCAADRDDSLRAIAVPPASTSDAAPLDTTAYPPNGEVAEVLAIDNNFLPQVVNVVAGTTVHWRNNGRNDHNVIPADDPTWGVGEDLFAPKDEYSSTFDRVGTFVYYCSIHGTAAAGMFGTVVVAAP